MEGGSATAISVSGSGNAVTSVTKNGTTISVVKGATFLTSHQSLAAYLTKTEASSTYQPKGNYLTSHQSLANYYTKGETDSKLSGYLPLSGGTMTGLLINNKGIKVKGRINNSGDDEGILIEDSGNGYAGLILRSTTGARTVLYDTSTHKTFLRRNNGTNQWDIYFPDDAGTVALTKNIPTSLKSPYSLSWSGYSTGSYDGSSAKSFVIPSNTNQLTNGAGFITSSASISGNAATATNADKLDGIHANGLLTALSNSDKGISITVGGTTKSVSNISVNYASSAGNADMVDYVHIKRWGGIPVVDTTGVMEIGNYIDFHRASDDSVDFATRVECRGVFKNVVGLPSNGGTLALTSDNVASATKLQTPRTIWGQSFDGTANVSGALSGATTISASNTISTTLQNGALKIGNTLTPISALNGRVIFNTGYDIRFGETDWEWNKWAGLKYNHSKKTIYLGIADGSVFHANSAQTGGTVNLVNCSLKVDNTVCVPYDTIGISFRSTDYTYWGSWLSHQTAGHEALVIASQNDNTAIMFVNGESYANISNSRYQSLTPALMIKNNIVQLGYPYNDFSGDYRLRVNGSTYIRGDLYTTSNILAQGGVTAYSSSDIRLKQDLRKLDYLGIIKSMGGTFGFAWKKDGKRSIGWIAQHVLCNPHLKDIVETDEKGYYKINYWSPKLIATAFGAIEQVGDEVSRLKARVVFLESEVQRLSGEQVGSDNKRLGNKNIKSLN